MTARGYIARAERALLTGQPALAQLYMRRATQLIAADRHDRALQRVERAFADLEYQLAQLTVSVQATAEQWLKAFSLPSSMRDYLGAER